MTDYIVLLKQVPDITQITDNAFNPETGTLIRSRLSNVINQVDTQALALAHNMRRQSGEGGARIICLSMGPPSAEEVLRYGLVRLADLGVLLTDRALSGADTAATACPLAAAIRRIVAHVLSGNTDYYVVCGMQSADGDTAQVPAQVAEDLGAVCIPYVTQTTFAGDGFRFKRIISGGSQEVRPRRLPAVITVARYDFPLFQSFAGLRRSRRAKIVCWGAKDIEAKSSGAKGSKTQVLRVFAAGKTNRLCRETGSVQELAERIGECLRGASSQASEAPVKLKPYVLPAKRQDAFDRTFEALEAERRNFDRLARSLRAMRVKNVSDLNGEKRKALFSALGDLPQRQIEEMLAALAVDKPYFQGEVWVAAECGSEGLRPCTSELLSKAQELADSLEAKLGVFLVGHDLEQPAREIASKGADIVHLVEHVLLKDFDPLLYTKVYTDIIGRHSPQIVLYSATPQGRVLAPMVAYRLGCGLTADCTSLEIRDRSRRGEIGILLQTRPALGGNIMASICSVASLCQMATVRPGVFRLPRTEGEREAVIIRHEVTLSPDERGMEILGEEQGIGEVDFDTPVIVSGGRGLLNQENYRSLLLSLCVAIRTRFGIEVEQGASRTAVEQGLAARIRQVGQTGAAVAPKVYIALGISGAIQHMIGVSNSENIIAINSDPQAPIFRQCDYYFVGNVETVVPELVSALKT